MSDAVLQQTVQSILEGSFAEGNDQRSGLSLQLALLQVGVVNHFDENSRRNVLLDCVLLYAPVLIADFFFTKEYHLLCSAKLQYDVHVH